MTDSVRTVLSTPSSIPPTITHRMRPSCESMKMPAATRSSVRRGSTAPSTVVRRRRAVSSGATHTERGIAALAVRTGVAPNDLLDTDLAILEEMVRIAKQK